MIFDVFSVASKDFILVRCGLVAGSFDVFSVAGEDFILV